MARPLRIEFAGALYHVTSRGDGQEDIYLDDSDREQFLSVGWGQVLPFASPAVVSSVLGIVAGVVLTPLIGPPLAGFVAGMIAGKGDIRAGVLGAITGGMFNVVGDLGLSSGWDILAHGLVGGVTSELQGGTFAQGMLSAGFAKFGSQAFKGSFVENPTEFADYAGNAAKAAMLGGVGSVLGGGSLRMGL